VQEHRKTRPSHALFARLLTEALAHEPPPFNEQWLNYVSPPDLSFEDSHMVEDDFSYLQHMLLYQIADLHRMGEAGVLTHPHAYFGLDSPTGFRWYNFHPADYLFCATGGMSKDAPDTQCNWADLAIFLWLGQIYE
jgi:hypothetical protein